MRDRLLPLLAAVWLFGCSGPDREHPAAERDRLPPGEPLRIVTLAPHLAEIVYAAGAGEFLVGVSAYSNYPDDVLKLPQVGDAFMLDQEQLRLLRPDVLLAWQSGTPAHTVAELRRQGYRVEVLRTQGLDDVAAALQAIGGLAGREAQANTAARKYREELERLRKHEDRGEPIRVFYQISARPLYTVNGAHYVSELINLCGGRNIFADLGALAPLVSEESVLARDPEVLLAGRIGAGDDALAQWKRWPELAANRMGNLFYVHADLLARATPRLTATGAAICASLNEGRRNRAAATRL